MMRGNKNFKMKLLFIITVKRIKKVLVVALFFLMMIHVNAQSTNVKYNKQLADSLGADDYGMKMYVLVILKPGSNKIDDKQKADSLFVGHLQNISHLATLGKLVAAGPLKRNEKGYDGIFILNVKTTEEATTLLQTDPAIKAKMLDTELFQWYGSAALPLYLKFHDNVKKKDF
jgi:uncharacterized protein YciI